MPSVFIGISLLAPDDPRGGKVRDSALGSSAYSRESTDINRLIPWGNAHRVNSSSWTCQHGPDECLLNMVEACAVNLWHDQKVHFKLIQCIERLVLSGKQNMWPSCLGEQHLNQEIMNHCYKSATGTDLQLKNAYETEHLQTPHKFVPWVLVNNKTLEQDYQNYTARVCKAYTGPNKPAACSRTPKINSSDIGSSVPQVCYARKTDIPFASEVKKAAKDLRTEVQA